jgi:glucokinase
MMTHDSEEQETTTVIQSYATEQDAERAIAALRDAGFGADAIGILARRRGAEEEVAQASGATPIATGGVYVAGGIPLHIAPALATGRFIHAFQHKGRFAALLARMPVHVVVRRAALVGAARYGLGLTPADVGDATDRTQRDTGSGVTARDRMSGGR